MLNCAVFSMPNHGSDAVIRGNGGVQVATIGGSNRLLRCKEAAEFLSVPQRTLRENWRRWGLTAHKVGRAIRFRVRDIETYLEMADV